MIYFSWIILTILVTYIGSKRKIGGIASFFISLILSPLIGIICVLASDKLSTIAFQENLLQQTKIDTSAEEIEQLYSLWKKGILTEAEYLNKKNRILNR